MTADDQYRPLLQACQESGGEPDSELVSDEIKVTMVLEASGDIRAADASMREIELRSKGLTATEELERESTCMFMRGY